MKITIVRVNYGETRSVNFQACRAEVSLEAEIGDTDPDEARKELEAKCVQMVHEVFSNYAERNR